MLADKVWGITVRNRMRRAISALYRTERAMLLMSYHHEGPERLRVDGATLITDGRKAELDEAHCRELTWHMNVMVPRGELGFVLEGDLITAAQTASRCDYKRGSDCFYFDLNLKIQEEQFPQVFMEVR